MIELSAAEARGAALAAQGMGRPRPDGRIDARAAACDRRRRPAAARLGQRPLAEELRLLAGWLELDQVSVARKGDLAGRLAKAVAAARSL